MLEVYLDPSGHLWSSDREALHALAARIGMKRIWFQDRPTLYHYDLMTPHKRSLAYRAGAIPCTSRELVVMMRSNDA